MAGFGFNLAALGKALGGGEAAQAFKGADMSGKLGMISQVLGGDLTGLHQMIGQQMTAQQQDPRLQSILQRYGGGQELVQSQPPRARGALFGLRGGGY